MQKKDLLSLITEFSAQKQISMNEIEQAYEMGQGKKVGLLVWNMGLSEILYITGGLIVFIGAFLLVGQNWFLLDPYTKILVTLGLGIVTYIIGIILTNKEHVIGAVGLAFHLIAALLIPLGLFVTFSLSYIVIDPFVLMCLISGILYTLYMASYLLYKKPIFTIFSIIYGSWFFYAVIDFLVRSNPLITFSSFTQYRMFFAGVSYVLLGYYFSISEQRGFSRLLYTLGCLLSLTAGLMLGGWTPAQNFFWVLSYPALIAFTLFLSVRLKSRIFHFFGTLYLMLYVIKISIEYFSRTLGWPFSLMICGIALIGVGFYAFRLNNKYLKRNTSSGDEFARQQDPV